MLYAGYFDESDESPSFSLAGYIAASDTWIHLEWKWRDLLKRWKVRYFKASECSNLLGEFAQYREDPEDLRSQLSPQEFATSTEAMTQFIDLMCAHKDDLRGYGAVAIKDDFFKVTSHDERAARALLDNPYYACFQLCLVASAQAAREGNLRRHPRDWVLIKPIFDSHERISGTARRLFDAFVKENPLSAELLYPIDYDDDIRLVRLQVADVLAYETRKLLTGELRGLANLKLRKSMERLLEFTYHIYRLDYNTLIRWAHSFKGDGIPIDPINTRDFTSED